jgi:3-hydroxyacyl-CoA dehydrogenase / enoyl-CoA hydratase / 3-hydroxybutyryl-CoA epimerase / enoyl-CoA isomerase
MFQGQSLRLTALAPQDAGGAAGLVEICFDRQGEAINKFDARTLLELRQAVALINAEASVRGLLLTSAKSVFIVGADITEFDVKFALSVADLEADVARMNEVFNGLEDLRVPSVAALNGYALGGGLECGLAACYRVMSNDAQVGVPEVKLGLFPGFGGTVRLARLAGPVVAMDWVATGQSADAATALAVGVVDEVVAPEAMRSAALAMLNKAVAGGLDWRARRALKMGPAPMPANATEREAMFSSALARIEKAAAPHQPAALAAAQLVQRAAAMNRTGALAEESLAFAQIAKTQAAGSLVRAFLSSQVVKKLHKQQGPAAQLAAQAVVQRVLTAFMKALEQLLQGGVPPERIDQALQAAGWAPGEPMRRAAPAAATAAASPAGSAPATTAATPGAASLSDDDIVQRTLLPMVLQATEVLEDGVLGSPAELDIALLAGMGWPAYMGGPLHYADWLGLITLVEHCDQHRAAGLGAAFEPSKVLRDRAARSLRFYS